MSEPAKKAVAKKAVAKKTGPKVLPRKAPTKPTSESPRYAGPAATGKVDRGPKVPTQHNEDVISSDPRRKIPGGTSPYLDEIQREEAEVRRAKVEGREPDLENPPAVQGTPLRPSKKD